MKPEFNSLKVFGITRAKAKMYEYAVPNQYHIKIPKDPASLLRLTIGVLGEYSSIVNSDDDRKPKLDELKNTLYFSAQYFDSLVNSHLHSSLDSYLLLLASASYYLCDYPGSSTILARKVVLDGSIEAEGLDNLLLALLTNNFALLVERPPSRFDGVIDSVFIKLQTFFQDGFDSEGLVAEAGTLRHFIYDEGTARQLLIADIICSIIEKRIENSSWKALPLYTGIDIAVWTPIIKKERFIKELWPAQMLLGKNGVFSGKSAVVQMPTSAGKTKAIEIVIRSSFFSNRAQTAVIVAPFKALCNEISSALREAFQNEDVVVDSPSDVFQFDASEFESIGIQATRSIIVVTPEKLLYIVRQSPEIGEYIGLVIYDEGHQFDNGLRGISYELLISSLRSLIRKDSQTVLISAVISNSTDIGKWLNPDESQVVSGIDLVPTNRSIAFASWQDSLARLYFVDKDNIDASEFYVPRILERKTLAKKGRERNERFFPEKENGNHIALDLGLKLFPNGAVAIFSGNKASIKTFCETLLDVKDRGYQFEQPSSVSDSIELNKLVLLHKKHFGDEFYLTKCAELGLLTHSGNVPHGIRLSVEYAMQQGKIRFIICTSTLAQGVNLPIRYLIINSVYQAGEKILTRDFHNLIGRAGRSGIHTEGTIIFADPTIYDKRISKNDKWRWEQMKDLLDKTKSEPCISTLSSFFKPFSSDDDAFTLRFSAVSFLTEYLKDKAFADAFVRDVSARNAEKKFSLSGLSRQVSYKVKIVGAIESYLLSYWDNNGVGNSVEALAKETLAYSLAEESEKEDIVNVFNLIAERVQSSFQDIPKRKAFGRTLLGINELEEIEVWTLANLERIQSANHSEELLETLWETLVTIMNSEKLGKITPQASRLGLAKAWINGVSYLNLFNFISTEEAKTENVPKRRKATLEGLIDICENVFSHEASLVLGAFVEVLNFNNIEGRETVVGLINELQKRLKYGLASPLAISFYEIGFSDRVLANELAAHFDGFALKRRELLNDIRRTAGDFDIFLSAFPSYFQYVLRTLLEGK